MAALRGASARRARFLAGCLTLQGTPSFYPPASNHPPGARHHRGRGERDQGGLPRAPPHYDPPRGAGGRAHKPGGGGEGRGRAGRARPSSQGPGRLRGVWYGAAARPRSRGRNRIRPSHAGRLSLRPRAFRPAPSRSRPNAPACPRTAPALAAPAGQDRQGDRRRGVRGPRRLRRLQGRHHDRDPPRRAARRRPRQDRRVLLIRWVRVRVWEFGRGAQM
jgi:hypothetical protein